MLTHRLDVPCDGPQLVAFPIETSRLDAIRDGLRAIVEHADIEPLRAVWDARACEYFDERARARWRVPTSTVVRVCNLAETAWRALTPASRTASVPETVAAIHERLAADTVDVLPDAWFGAERGYDNVARQMRVLHAFESDYLLSLHLETFARALGHLFSPQLDNVELPSGPAGSLSEVLREDHELLVERAIALDDVLEASVGPFRATRGPGPYLDLPARCASLSDARWIPCSRAGIDVANCWCSLSEEALAAAAKTVRAAEAPGRGWWSTRPKTPTNWRMYRDRFAALLEESHAHRRSVLLRVVSQDWEGHEALGPEWGELHRVHD